MNNKETIKELNKKEIMEFIGRELDEQAKNKPDWEKEMVEKIKKEYEKFSMEELKEAQEEILRMKEIREEAEKD